MKSVWLLIALLFAVTAYAQTMPPSNAPPPTAAELVTQLQKVGCTAEEQTAAQTIVQLRQQITDLRKKRSHPPSIRREARRQAVTPDPFPADPKPRS